MEFYLLRSEFLLFLPGSDFLQRPAGGEKGRDKCGDECAPRG